MISCFGYLRVSTVRQGEGVSLQEQRSAIEDCAIKRGLIISEWFEERETASKAGRPVFNQMIKRLRHGHAEGLVVHKLDRSARNLHDWAIVSALMDVNIVFHIATEPIDFTTRGGRMTADFLAVIAADFSRNQREETRKGLYGRLKQGLYPFKAPLGYLDTGRGQAKAPCPKNGPLIKDLYALYLSGQHSLRSLHAEMNRRGLRGFSGKPVSLHGIEKILSNTFYHGLITIARTGETFDGKHKPLVTKGQFAQVQLIKAGRCGPKVTRHNHPYQGIFRCGLCDGPMVPELQKGHVYYRCTSKRCKMTCMREDRIERALLSRLSEAEFTPSDIGQIKDRWDAGDAHKDIDANRRSVVARIEALETKLARMTDLLIDGTLDKQSFETSKQTTNFELSQLRGQLDLMPNPTELRNEQAEYIKLFSSLVDTYRAGTRAERRELLQNAFCIRHLLPGEVRLAVRDWVDVRGQKITQNNSKLLIAA
jgi:DNA invertase Pin-like site-specific DNA recombinase